MKRGTGKKIGKIVLLAVLLALVGGIVYAVMVWPVNPTRMKPAESYEQLRETVEKKTDIRVPGENLLPWTVTERQIRMDGPSRMAKVSGFAISGTMGRGGVTFIGNNPDGVNINSRCGSTHLRDLAGRSVKTLREQGAEQLWRDVKFRVGLALHHDDWRHRADLPLRRELKAQRAAALQGPQISIIVPLYNTPLDFLEELLDSVVNQTYRNWELCCVDAGTAPGVGEMVQQRAAVDPRIRYRKLEKNELIPGNTNKGIEMATGDFIALLDHDDILHPCALWYAAKAIAEQGADFVYTDEATFEGKVENVVLYHFKPDFMLDNLRSNNYICHLTLFSRRLMDAAGGPERMEYNGSQDYELFLRLTEMARKIVHIPHALYYWRSSPGSTASDISAKTYCIDAGIAALKAHYARCGVAVDDVSLIPGTPGYYKTDYTIDHPGRVSILIPTCDHIRDLETCVESIYARTTYPDFEIILIENNSKAPETFRTYERMQKEHPDTLKVVTWEGKGFNYSALNNFGEKFATGEYLLLLNNDTEVITAAWLEEMVMYAQQKRVGCVGAKLLYPDDTIQHAGVGFGIGGVAGHLHKYYPASSDGYMGRLNYVQDVYADTAACLLIRKEIYDEVGGLDESYAVAFNDVDFCVRVRQAGYTNVFTPFAQLYHYESKSRGMEDNPEKQKRFQGEVLRFQARWGNLLAAGDPCTNPNFDIQREDFSLKILPLE